MHAFTSHAVSAAAVACLTLSASASHAIAPQDSPVAAQSAASFQLHMFVQAVTTQGNDLIAVGMTETSPNTLVVRVNANGIVSKTEFASPATGTLHVAANDRGVAIADDSHLYLSTTPAATAFTETTIPERVAGGPNPLITTLQAGRHQFFVGAQVGDRAQVLTLRNGRWSREGEAFTMDATKETQPPRITDIRQSPFAGLFATVERRPKQNQPWEGFSSTTHLTQRSGAGWAERAQVASSSMMSYTALRDWALSGNRHTFVGWSGGEVPAQWPSCQQLSWSGKKTGCAGQFTGLPADLATYPDGRLLLATEPNSMPIPDGQADAGVFTCAADMSTCAPASTADPKLQASRVAVTADGTAWAIGFSGEVTTLG